MEQQSPNVDAAELHKFEQLASRWWDPHGEFKPLHKINPLRFDYIDDRAPLSGTTVLDVGCGGGLLAEAMAETGANVTGIDMVDASLQVARLHLMESKRDVRYMLTTAEDFARDHCGEFDVVTCLEMLEHVPEPGSVVAACAQLVRPGGHVFFSTINRNPKSYLLAVIGAEYLLRMLPRGTHDYNKFIRPSELDDWARDSGLRLDDITGMSYNPLSGEYRLGDDVDVNYLAHYVRPEAVSA